MLIHKISVSNFMALGAAELELPEAGVTVLTGHNGAGKSRFIEAVAYAYWGQTLRGSDPWPEGVAGSVAVLSAEGDVTRKITAKGSKSLSWNAQKADTASRTQEHIDARVGDFEFWRRTSVFSSADASHFSGATDGERKRIMEQLLGLDVFDRAQRQCLDELGQAKAAVMALEVKRAEALGRQRVADARLSSLGVFRPFEATLPPPPPEAFELFSLGQQVALDDARARVTRLEQELNSPRATPLVEELLDARQYLTECERSVKLARAGKCEHCAQPWHGSSAEALEGLRQLAKTKLGEVTARQEQALAIARAKSRASAAELSEAQQSARALETARDSAERAARAESAHAQAHAAWAAREAQRRQVWQQEQLTHEQAVSAARSAQRDACDELFELDDALDEARALRDELDATSAILGVKGLRGHVLGHALEGVEHVANYWLQQIAPGRALSIRAEGEAGKIVINLHGYGGGKYKAASSGERRRIDAPLLLALAEVAGAGKERGTLFLDEVFDALDTEGRELVCRALGELGATQSVVVITHSEDLAARVPAAQRFNVERGELKRL